MTIQTSSVMGKEQTSTRTLTNPSTTETMRIDYFSMMRKWRVRLLRYGLRMTYDLAIPEPGATLRALHAQLADLEQQLSSPFTFPLSPTDITYGDFGNYAALQKKYSVSIPLPPTALPPVRFPDIPPAPGGGQWTNGTLKGNIPEGYEVATPKAGERTAILRGKFNTSSTDPFLLHFIGAIGDVFLNAKNQIDTDLSDILKGAQGSQSLNYLIGGFLTGQLELELALQPTIASIVAWRKNAWQALYNAARDTFYTDLQRLSQQRDALKAEIENVDTLTLRREEREEIMKSVLRWLLGPEFDFMPQGVKDLFFDPTSIDPTTMKAITVEQWVQKMSEWFVNDDTHMSPTNWSVMYMYGEMVKFIMEAIEWENLLYILYPYFWDIPFAWGFVRRLQHPDPTRESFLRAGSARVVLTIRPGWESDFLAFVENGEFGQKLAKNHPYMTISDEMQAYANTNYPGIPPANPETSYRPLLTPRQRSAWHDMQTIIGLLEKYKAKNGAYPTAATGLAALSTFGTVPAADPWGKPYQYLSPGQYNDYDLSSLGADGAPGGEGDNADVTSWASASLIGEWFEYTPSHGLDIGITTALANMA